MNLSFLSNSRMASDNVNLFGVSEPVLDPYANGIYIGKTKIYKIPFMLDVERLINPHIAVLGMTGSGKTYLLKSMLIRSRLNRDFNILIIDWNGEYNDIVNFLSGNTVQVNSPDFNIDAIPEGVTNINLSNLKSDNDRKDVATRIVNTLIELMHRLEINRKVNTVILLDEAWRMLGSSKSLGQLFREARKHGLSIIVATQLAKDIDNEVLSNSACLFIFRLQNSEDYKSLISAGVISEEHKEYISNLKVGGCMVHLALKDDSNHLAKFFIKKVDGFSTDFYTINGDKMQIKITSEKFSKLTGELDTTNEIKSKIVNFVEMNERTIDSVGLLRFLLKNGLKRTEIVAYMKLLGFDDLQIVTSYESAKGKMIEIGESV